MADGGKPRTEREVTDPIHRVIPWRSGELPVVGLEVGQEQTTAALQPGRWALSPRSTIPFAQVRMASAGTRQLTWGETVEVPHGETGTVGNASFHKGDAIFIGIGTGWGWGSCCRPRRVTIVQKWYQVEAPARFVTQWIDTRTAVRAYFVQSNINADFIYTVRLEQPTGSAQVTNATSLRSVTWQQAVVGFRAYIPLGFGSGEQRQPAPGNDTVQELRPMALLDRARVEVDLAQAGLANIDTTTDAYFVLEY